MESFDENQLKTLAFINQNVALLVLKKPIS